MSQFGCGRAHVVARTSTRPAQPLPVRAALLALLLALTLPATSQAATYTFTPVADGYTRSDSAESSYGTTTRIYARNAPKQIRHSYLRFKVALPPGDTVSAATVNLTAASSGSNIALRDVADDTWSETGLTWNSAPVFGTDPIATVASVAKGKVAAFDATELVAGSGLVSMALTTTSSTTGSFHSRESSSSGRPRLVVQTGLVAPSPGGTLPPPPDDAAPETLITSAPETPTTATTANFSFTGADDSTPAEALSYECSRDGSAYATCAPIKTYNPVDPGTHSFAVRAIDEAGNVDPTPAVETWQVDPAPDTLPPSAPSNLVATPGDSRVVLTWNAANDNVAVTGYRVYRSGVQIAAPSGTSHTDAGLANGTTYTYVVRALDAAGNLSAASSQVSATPAAAPPPPTGWEPWKWDARNAPLDPNNATLTAQFLQNGLKSPNLAMNDWAVATADAKSGDPQYSIPRTQQGGSITVRIPLGTKPDPSGDGHLTVRDVEKGIETDFWQAKYDAVTQRIVSTSAAVSFPLGAVNEQTSGWGGNAANTPLRRGLVTPEQISAGRITETMQFSVPNIAGTTSSFRYPALHNAPTGTNNSLAEGTWIRLDPAVDVDALAIPTWQKVIARALQDHGAINRDNGGTFAIYGRNPINGGASWSSVGLTGTAAAFSPSFPWNRVQVLAPPPR